MSRLSQDGPAVGRQQDHRPRWPIRGLVVLGLVVLDVVGVNFYYDRLFEERARVVRAEMEAANRARGDSGIFVPEESSGDAIDHLRAELDAAYLGDLAMSLLLLLLALGLVAIVLDSRAAAARKRASAPGSPSPGGGVPGPRERHEPG